VEVISTQLHNLEYLAVHGCAATVPKQSNAQDNNHNLPNQPNFNNALNQDERPKNPFTTPEHTMQLLSKLPKLVCAVLK
jgi:hypothetical protein